MTTLSHFALCIDNASFEVSLERRKVYPVIADAEAEAHDQLRVIDESGDDYLHPKRLFIGIELPPAVGEKLYEAA